MGSSDSWAPQVEKVRSWLSGEHRECAIRLVRDYYTEPKPFPGSRFDKLAGGSSADEITVDDLNAVRSLSIGFPRSFVSDLDRGDARQRIHRMFAEIPSDVVLEDLSCADFDRLLGPDSAAWNAWYELAGWLKAAKARAPLVGASKLMAAKRPLLVPLEDSFVRRALDCRRRDIWQVIYCIVQDPQVREGLAAVRQEVPTASHITLHRVLDVIAWRKHQGH